MHLKKKIINIRGHNKINIIILIIFTLIIALYLSFKYISSKLGPSLIEYAEIEINRLASIIVSNAINKEVNEAINVEEIFIIEKDNDGQIQTIDYDSRVVNRILIAAGTTAQMNLKYLSEGAIEKITAGNSIEEMFDKYDRSKMNRGIIYEIPMGIASNNPFLANLGPKIPVRFKLIGDITTNLNTSITDFGINSAMLETKLYIKVKFVIVLPIISKETMIEYSLPIAVKIIQGDIPNYYLNGYNQNSNMLTIPVEE